MIPKLPASIYQPSTCAVMYGSLGHVDDHQLPQTGKPWTTIAAHDFIHRVDVIAPQDCYPALCEKFVEQRRQPVYARVTMALEQLLQADFLIECVKKGDVLMLSQGQTSTDNVFSLRKGILRMYLDKETFERAGLEGKPYGTKGNRGHKARWIVSYDVANPPGKKASDRLLYACQRVLDKPLTWLLCDTDPASPSLKSIEAHKPTLFTANAATVQKIEVSNVKPQIAASILADGDRTSLGETATELYEWLSLIRLRSPRAAANDTIDPFLSRYSAPGGAHGQTNVCLLSWQGFMAATWLRSLVTDALEACSPQQWVFISATTLSTNVARLGSELALLRPSGVVDEYLMWETSKSN
ncbi:hypothetical protein L249_5951 [Ophiocordyceps polyrhachis-furcata BCC 54312]|uniref:Uncharacterized protein n=1 Tax=Ophiocordyceps polyrhachis-furcata BCC 54312 TaxID=1330021 RepID=A0A367LJA9_9HYPO|nr:hypothetical protein L249_5951 [Ophiocordyceps polyrhachis-furcata BCC 54312]